MHIKLIRLFGRFAGAQQANAAVEFAIILPVLVMLLGGIMQFGAIFFYYNSMSQVARDTTRRLAVGDLETQAEAQALVAAQLPDWGFTPSVITTINEDSVAVEVKANLTDLAIINVFGLLSGKEVSAKTEMRK